MNLTKGKISKLYKKNKQSVRRRKNGKGKTGRNKTFRKTKSLNLANKSLKNFHKKRGGAEENEQPVPIPVSETPVSETPVSETPVSKID